MNKGQVGNWKNQLTQEMIQRFETWEKEGLSESDLKFKYEL